MKQQLYVFDEKTLKYEPHNRSSFKIIVTVIVAFLLLGATSIVKINRTFEKIPVIVDHKEEILNPNNVKNCIKELNIKFEDIVWAQVMIESQNCTSQLAVTQNNITGMEWCKGRPTTSKNIGNRFAFYNSFRDCLIDYSLWQTFSTRSNISREDYLKLLDRVYCPSNLEENKGELYSVKIKKFLKQTPY